jgi:lysophospholipase L1-like esterase
MPPEPDRQDAPPSRRNELILTTIISVLVACAALGGFAIGRYRSDTLLQRISEQATPDQSQTLLSAGMKPISMREAMGPNVKNTEFLRLLQGTYGLQGLDQASFVDVLGKIVWVPPYQPAPFVGHMARPFASENLRINAFGFRDERDDYRQKPPGTVRIFLTGGSTAWGVGASSDQKTIARQLERLLNEQKGAATGRRYEVINASFPGWSTTQEKILIEQRLIDLQPDAILMFSGTNDVFWSMSGRDLRWFFTYMDQNFVAMLNEIYKSSQHPESVVSFPMADHPVECSEVSKLTARNVEMAAAAAQGTHARLIFALPPTILSTAKALTRREGELRKNAQNEAYWTSCYQAIRDSLSAIAAKNYRFIDVSRAFGELDAATEVFLDPSHFSDNGSKAIAQTLFDQIDWAALGQAASRQ